MKIAIGVMSGTGWIHHDYAMSLMSMIGFTRTQVPLGLVFVKAASSLVANVRNQCVDAAVKTECDKLLMIDSDMTFPHDTLVRLLSHGVDIVGGVYMRRGGVQEMIGAPLAPGNYDGLVEMKMLGTGCILIDMKIFRELPRPWFRCPPDEVNGVNIGEDVQFCRDATALGYRLWADASLDLGHIDQTVLKCPR